MLVNYNKNAYNQNFQSTIKLLSPDAYKTEASKILQKYFVDSPWTVNESVLADSAKTGCVIDCSVLGLTDGQQVLMMHICPTRKENDSFSKIVDFIKSKVDLTNDNLQGFILGSKPKIFIDDLRSTELFDKFKNFLEQYKIPFSYFKGGNHQNPHSVAYRSNTDEWLISNEFITKDSKNIPPEKFIEKVKMFDEFNVSDLDEISW